MPLDTLIKENSQKMVSAGSVPLNDYLNDSFVYFIVNYRWLKRRYFNLMKSEELKSVSDEELNEIYNALEGDEITPAQFAIRKCVVDGISDERIISDLKELKNNGAIKFVKMSTLAIAALDILGAEKYTGTDELIREFIQTKFFSNEK